MELVLTLHDLASTLCSLVLRIIFLGHLVSRELINDLLLLLTQKGIYFSSACGMFICGNPKTQVFILTDVKLQRATTTFEIFS